MTDPTNPPPVFLPEPDIRPSDNPPPAPTPGHRDADLRGQGWESILAPGETVVWEGRSETRQLLSRQNRNLVIFLLVGATFAVAALGDSPIPVFFGIAAYFMFERRNRRKMNAQNRRYLLTDRAAYIAEAQGAELTDLRSFPITANMRLGLGPRSVSFAVRYNREGREEAEGFLDIPDAQRVHDLIRDIQKAKA